MYNKMKILVSSLIMSIMMLGSLPAQDGVFHGSVGISLLNLQPRGQFGQTVENDGWGVNILGTMNLWQSPLSVGINVLITNYGSETQHIPFNYWAGSLVTVEMETTNTFFAGHLFLRLKPFDWVIQPYVDGLIGFNALTTETTIRDEDDWADGDEDNEIASSTNQEDSAFSYGAAGGLMIKLYTPKKQEGSPFQIASIYLDLGVRYLIGSEAEYLNVNKEGWMTTTDPADGPIQTEFHPDRSETDVATFQLGVTVQF